ncbi:Tripartite tricarboxylate transporter TctB family protein [Rhizobium sp. RU33A]|uniref:tripartite tricarboxylate transporter TctB family protein n=1 Tax=Rhizobium sp. RU33A TaxID=1907413 RepID=UPI000954C364|nr:tripartite tricarboxylate transporter TctB family protein [Rhizobium sp. RU33A]SIR00318.1 Tripartite tricarboxylate transporter TctB family protein [Rhizobium sp. RU33A]
MIFTKASRADFWTGLFWVVAGGAIVAMSARLPIPRHLGASAMTSPGMVPGLLGAALLALGMILSLRAWKGRSVLGPDDIVDPASVSTRRPVVAGVLMVSYALALTFGLPFTPLTVLFVTLFIMAFNWQGQNPRQKMITCGGAAVMAMVFAVTLEFVFEQLFFVRLP